jgi:tetratricopeptide (TPR) repeat protein
LLLAWVLACATGVVAVGEARAQTAAAGAENPLALYQAGRRPEALALAERVLKDTPNDLAALYVAAKVHQDQDRVDAAIALVEQLNRYHPGLPAGWELATQLFQAKGNLRERDLALRQLIDTQAASLDRNLRQRRFVVRDRLVAGGRVVLVQDHTDTGMPDTIRYAFVPEGEGAAPRDYLVVQTDSETSEYWRQSGILPPGKRLFHLDSIYVGADGRAARAMYLTFADLPDYDTLRAQVLDVLAGKVKPMSGKAGGLTLPAPAR